MTDYKVPIIALVGQTNVGKSSIFNLLLKRRENIVAREEGTTRDSLGSLISLRQKSAWLVDTAGLKKAEDDFEMTIQEHIETAIETADIICLVVEADKVLDQKDRLLAKKALKSQKEVVLIVNKRDLKVDATTSDYQKLGIKNIFLLSTTTKWGLDALVDHLAEKLPLKKIQEETDSIKIALLGRPNVGKSALFNALCKKQQAVVSARAGTTRDVNKQKIRYFQQTFELLDTAGLRRSGKRGVGIEKFSALRTLAAIEKSDICLLLMDANEFGVALDKRIAGLVKESGKGLILILSKWDDLEDKSQDNVHLIQRRLAQEFDFTPWASLIFTSSLTGQNVSKILEISLQIFQKRQQKIQTSSLNQYLQKAILKHPPSGLKNSRPRLNYIVQTDCSPPTFQFFGSATPLLHWSYKRFLEKELRQTFDYQGTALVLKFKEKH